jgi:hypothetical protein
MNDFNWRRPVAIGADKPKPSRAKAPQAGRALDMQGRRTVDLAPRTLGAISIHNVVDTNKTQRISRGRSI